MAGNHGREIAKGGARLGTHTGKCELERGIQGPVSIGVHGPHLCEPVVPVPQSGQGPEGLHEVTGAEGGQLLPRFDKEGLMKAAEAGA